MGDSGVRAMVCGKLFAAHQVGDDEDPVGFQDPAHLSKCLSGIIKMRKRCKADHPVENPVCERYAVNIGTKNQISRCVRFCLCLTDHIDGEVKSADLPGGSHPLPQIGEKDPRPCAHVKDAFSRPYLKFADQIEKAFPHRGGGSRSLPNSRPLYRKNASLIPSSSGSHRFRNGALPPIGP